MEKLSLCRDKIDISDQYISMNLKLSDNISEVDKVDYRSTCPAIYVQDGIGSCAASALACVSYFNLIKYKIIAFDASRLFMYYNTRLLKHTVDIDEGCSLRESLKAINQYGLCPEEMWPYNVNLFKVRPPLIAYNFGQKLNNITYYRIPQVLSHLCQCLIDRYLFVFGISVYSNFETDIANNGGYVSLPNDKDAYLGGHAVCAVGYDNEKSVFIIRNSWGTSWGDNGYFYLPYDYITDVKLAYDFWTFSYSSDMIDSLQQ